MDGQYLNNKKQNIQFLKDWIVQLKKEGKLENFYDDYHIDEIDSSINKENWLDSAFEIYKDYNNYLKSFFPQMSAMLCIDLGESKTKSDYPSHLDNNLTRDSEIPPSIYLFNKFNSNILDTLKECILLPNLTDEKSIYVFYKEEYDKTENSFNRTIFLTDVNSKKDL